MKTEYCTVQDEGRLRIVTLNRPEVLNALHADANDELAAVWDEFAERDDLWVGIVTGAGGRAFSAGNDLKVQAAGRRRPNGPRGFAGICHRFDMYKPMIAAVNGVAMGGGFETALACDIIVAAENAVFALPEPRVGLIAGGGGVHRLPRSIPIKQAMGMILTGRRVSAKEGFELGFVTEVVSEGQAVKEAIGVVPQDIALYPDMSARENLVFWGRMYGLRGEELTRRVDEVLELITLVDRQKDRVEKFSGGMKRRVNIGVALLHKPRVLYLDEPTVGIDPQSRRSILDGILALREQGMTILYTTHYMAEAQELSDRVGIVDHGKMIAVGTNQELVDIVGAEAHVVLSVDHYLEGMVERWGQVKGVTKAMIDEEQAVLLVQDANEVLPRLFEAAAAAGARITEVSVTEPNLEMVFLHLTGRALRE